MPQSIVGRSFSFCVWDIARGRIAAEAVEMIISSTEAQSTEDWDRIIAQNKEEYWYEMPETCERIARKLIAEGKIVQPCLKGLRPPDVSLGHWRQQGNLFSV